MTYDFLVGLYNDILQIIKGMCVKRFDLALEEETLETSRAFDIYLSCINGTSYFYTFPKFHYDALIAAGFDEDTAARYATDRNLIPEEDQAKCAAAEAKYTIDNYEEGNNYYRMLIGLPPLNTKVTSYIYPVDKNGDYYVTEDSTGTVEGLPGGVTEIILRTVFDDYNPVTDKVTKVIENTSEGPVELIENEDYIIQGNILTLYQKPLFNPDTLTIEATRAVPIHKYTTDQIGHLDTFGILDTIKADHPDAKYLSYLGNNAIDLLKARLSRPFDLLRIGDPSNPRTIDLFQREYYFARRYVTANYYNRNQAATKTLYDPVVGLLITSLTVRNIFALDEKSYLDFDEILNLILESYGMLDYFKRFPFIYKRRLVLALDTLLSMKGTDGVLIDVCKLFSPGQDLVADRYYLMKTQKRNPDGSVIESGDPDDMYNLTFLKAKIDDRDIHTSEEYRVDYKSVTENDYLWQIEKYGPDGVTITEEYRRLLEDPYNLRMVKYVDAQAAYDITSIIFEVCCFLNMLLESRFKVTKMILSNQYAIGSNISLNNKFASNGSSQLFTMLIFLLSAMAQKAGYDGNIVYDPETMSEVWQKEVAYSEIWHFNYQDLTEEAEKALHDYEMALRDIDIVTVDASKDPTATPCPFCGKVHKETPLVSTYRNLAKPDDFVLEQPSETPTAASIVRNYVNNRELFEAMTEIMNTTQSMERYQGIKIMRDLLFTRYMQENTLVTSDGKLAMTYRDLLNDIDPRLGKKLDSIVDNDDEMNAVIVYILEQLQDFFRSEDLKYLFLNTPDVYISLIREYIEIAINVFKASSVQLRNINVIFRFGDNDPVRIFDESTRRYHLAKSDEVHVQDQLITKYKLFLDEYVTVGDKIYIE